MYIITSKTRSKMKRNPVDRAKIRAEQQQYYKEQGLTKIAPLKGQSEDEMFEDVKKAGNFIKDSMDEQQEAKLKKIRQKHKDNVKPFKENEKKYHKMKEQRAKKEAEDRKINL